MGGPHDGTSSRHAAVPSIGESRASRASAGPCTAHWGAMAFLPGFRGWPCTRCGVVSPNGLYLRCHRCCTVMGYPCFRDTPAELCAGVCPGCHTVVTLEPKYSPGPEVAARLLLDGSGPAGGPPCGGRFLLWLYYRCCPGAVRAMPTPVYALRCLQLANRARQHHQAVPSQILRLKTTGTIGGLFLCKHCVATHASMHTCVRDRRSGQTGLTLDDAFRPPGAPVRPHPIAPPPGKQPPLRPPADIAHALGGPRWPLAPCLFPIGFAYMVQPAIPEVAPPPQAAAPLAAGPPVQGAVPKDPQAGADNVKGRGRGRGRGGEHVHQPQANIGRGKGKGKKGKGKKGK